MAGKTEARRRLRGSHNEARREQVVDAAIAVLAGPDSEPGTRLQLKQIAERAGVSRAVIYRHFDGRADLDNAVQGRALELLRAELVPVLSFEGAPIDIIRGIVAAYVGWADQHPALHELARQHPPGPGLDQLEWAVQQIVGQIEDLIAVGVEVMQVQVDPDDVTALDPLVFGLVGGVFTATRRWLSRPERRPDRDRFVELLTEAVWVQVAALVSARGGVQLTPDVPVEALLEAALDGAAG